jgi:hypothetical protein
VSTRELLLILSGLGVLILVGYVFGIEYRSQGWYLLLAPILAGIFVFGYFVTRGEDE